MMEVQVAVGRHLAWRWSMGREGVRCNSARTTWLRISSEASADPENGATKKQPSKCEQQKEDGRLPDIDGAAIDRIERSDGQHQEPYAPQEEIPGTLETP